MRTVMNNEHFNSFIVFTWFSLLLRVGLLHFNAPQTLSAQVVVLVNQQALL
ncbi:hypothetical protein ACRRTK_014418 [Alexandromys fortis]